MDLPTSGSDIDLVAASRKDKILQTVRSWVQSGNAPPWPACAGLSVLLRLQVGNLTIDSVGHLWRRRSPPSEGLQLFVPVQERHELIRRFHDSLFAGHLGVTRTMFRLLDRVYWPGLRRDVRTYIASCTICLARKSPCLRRPPMDHVLVMVDCFSRWTESCPLPDKTTFGSRCVFQPGSVSLRHANRYPF